MAAIKDSWFHKCSPANGAIQLSHWKWYFTGKWEIYWVEGLSKVAPVGGHERLTGNQGTNRGTEFRLLEKSVVTGRPLGEAQPT